MPSALRCLRWPALVAMTLALAGCFQPMYAPLSGRNVVAELRSIEVAPIQGLVGHYLANDLHFWLNGSGESVTPQYRLVVTLTERANSPLVDTVTGRATAASITISADYKLVPVGKIDPILHGNVVSVASYDRTSQRFANIRAARDAQIRDAHSLAELIRTRIAGDLAVR